MIKLKQPLGLADNLSAFDSEKPLTLSDTVRNQLAIPIADSSVVSLSNYAQGRYVTGIPKRDLTGKIIIPSNFETITQNFTTSGERFAFNFSQEVQGVFFWGTSTGGDAYFRWLGVWIPEREIETLQTNTSYLLNRRGTNWLFKCTGGFLAATLRIDGFY